MHPLESGVSSAGLVGPPKSSGPSARQAVLRHARHLHRAAQTGPLLAAMPVLRRLHAAGVFPGLTVTALYQQRTQVQRKHVLRTLAVEAGHASWEQFAPTLHGQAPAAVEGLLFEGADAHLNHWFSTLTEARAFALGQPGSRVLAVRGQAVVVVRQP